METISPPRRRSRRRLFGVVTIAAGLALVMSGCGSSTSAQSPTTSAPAPITSAPAPTSPADAPPPSTSAQAPTTSAPAPTSSADAPTASANAITVTTPGMEFDVAGTLHPGVATITLDNTDDEAHMMAVSRLKDGVTLDQVKAALAKSEDEAAKLLADGPDTMYGTPAPVGAGRATTVTSLDLPAGHYVLVCFFVGKDGMPHAAMGMISEMTVAGDKATEKPSSDGTITLKDDGAALPSGFAGKGTFLVSNTGSTPHSLSFAALDKGTTLPAYFQHVGETQQTGKPVDGGGGTLAGGVDGLMPGQSAYLTVDLKPGHYGFVSTVDATGPDLPAIHGEFDVS